jgi:TolA-binding protein
MDEDFQRGMTEGLAFGQQVGAKKGRADGKRSGDREGYAAGLRDAENGIDNPGDPGQPPDDPVPPPPPPPPPTEPPLPPPPPPEPTEPPPEPTEPPPEPTEQPPEPTEPSPELPPEPTEPPPEPPEPPPEGPGEMAPLPVDPEEIEAYALSKYPELVPRAASGSRMSKAREILGDPKNQQALRYSAGFAAGFAQGFSAARKEAYKEAYGPAFRRGYARGQADWRRRNIGDDGQPMTPQQQYDKALAEYRRGKFDEAADRFDMVLAGGADGELAGKAMYGLARCQYRSEDYRSSRNTARRLAETLPDSELADDGAFLAALCRERIRTGGFLGFGKKPDRKAAADDFDAFTRTYPDSTHAPEAHLRLAFLAVRLKQKARAVQSLRTLLDRWPEHPLAPRARRLLAKLEGRRG